MHIFSRSASRLPVYAPLWGACTAALLLLAAPIALNSQTAPVRPGATPPARTAPAQGLSRIEGVVFDSLAKRVVAGATVWIPGTTRSTTSNKDGHYELDSIAPGRQTIAYSAPAFDSAGLGTRGKVVTLRAGVDSVVNLASPSLRSLWSVLCKYRSSNGKDSGIVYGTVTDADTRTRLVKAPTIFKWYDMNKREKRVSFAESENRAVSDSTGTYYACGLPTDVAFTVRAYGNNAASGAIDYSLGDRSVTQIDFTVSKELVSLENTRGTATLHGFVRDGAGAPVAGAVVTATSADTSVRSDEKGEFTLRRLPAGTQGLQVRKIGLGIANKLVDLNPGQTTELFVAMPPARTLATYNVRAAKVMTMEESDFEDRRKMGFATVIDFEKRDFATAINALNNIPRVTLARGQRGNYQTATMMSGKRSCSPTYYLNGVKTDAQMMWDYPVDRIRYAEVYTSAYAVPARFITTGECGVVIYWTKDRW